MFLRSLLHGAAGRTLVALLSWCCVAVSAADRFQVFFAPSQGREIGIDASAMPQQVMGESKMPLVGAPFLQEVSDRVRAALAASTNLALYEPRDQSQVTELPDDLLLMALSVDGVDTVSTVGTDLEGNLKRLSVPVLEVSLSMVDPRTGQSAYTAVELVVGDDPAVAERIGARKNGRVLIPEGATPDERDRLLNDSHRVLLQEACDRVMKRMGAEFTPRVARVPVAHVLSRKPGRVMLAQGRSSGLFPGARLAGGASIVAVEAATADTAVARLVRGPLPERGALLSGFQPACRQQRPFLVGATRVLMTDGAMRASPGLAADQSIVEAAPGAPSAQPIYHRFLTSTLAASFGASGRPMAPTVGNLVGLKRAQSRMDVALNLARQDGDPQLFQSFVVPDYQVAAVLSNFIVARSPLDAGAGVHIEGNDRVSLGVRALVFVADLTSGDVVATGQAVAEASGEELRQGGRVQQAVCMDGVYARLASQALQRAATQCEKVLGQGLCPADLQVQDGKAFLRPPEGAQRIATERLQVWRRRGTVMGADGAALDLSVPAGEATCVGRAPDGRIQLAVTAEALAQPDAQLFVEVPVRVQGALREPRCVEVDATPGAGFTAEDLQAMAIGEMGAVESLRFALPARLSQRLLEYDRRRFVDDGSFRDDIPLELHAVPATGEVKVSLDASQLSCDEPAKPLAGAVRVTVQADGEALGKAVQLKPGAVDPASPAYQGDARARLWLSAQMRAVAELLVRKRLGASTPPGGATATPPR